MIVPQNLSCHYGYDYLGTLENGELLQDFYNRLDGWMWDFFVSNDEVTEHDSYSGYATNVETGEVEYISYEGYGIAFKKNLLEYYTEKELDCIGQYCDELNYWFMADNPIYYFNRTQWGMNLCWGNENCPYFFYVTTNKAENTFGVIEDFESVESRKQVREMIVEKLKEYYDATRECKTAFEKEIIIYNNLLAETDYAYDDIGSLYSHTIVGALSNTKTVCDGYAQTFQLLCNYCGIDCIWISGEAGLPGDMEGHAWNAVKLNEEWYCCDSTWDDRDKSGSLYDEEERYDSLLNYGYYGTNHNLLADTDCNYDYFNCPISYFSNSHVIYEKYKDVFPIFSDRDDYMLIYIMNEKAQEVMAGTLTSVQMREACDYVKNELKKENYCIQLYAWDSFITDEKDGETLFSDLIWQTVSEYATQSGRNLCLSPGSITASNGNFRLMRYEVLVSEKTECDHVTYWEHNVDGTGEGVGVEEYYADALRCDFPSVIDEKKVKAIKLLPGGIYGVEGNYQIIVPEGVKIVDIGSNCIEQIVLPESLLDFYGVESDMIRSVYIPKNTIHVINSYEYTNGRWECIYGYSGSAAEQYAKENNIVFYDLTGKERVDIIEVQDIILQKNEESINVDMSSTKLTGGIGINSVESEKMGGDTYKMTIKICVAESKALTPNTLASINGEIAHIECTDMNNATITYYSKCEDSVHVESVSIDKTINSIMVGERKELNAKVLPEYATIKSVSWSSDNESIATVDASGNVTAIAAGTATITVTATNGTEDTADDKTATCIVTVTAKKTSPEIPEKGAALVKNDQGKTVYYKDGEQQKDYSGLINIEGTWYYVEQGIFLEDKTGFVEYEGGIFLVVEGKLLTSKSGLVQDPYNPEIWYFLANGQVQTQYTGLAFYDGEWFYVNKGRLDTTIAAYIEYDGGLFYVAAGRILKEVSGLAKDPNGTDWYFLAEGQAQTQYTGLAMYDGEWFYVISGKLAEDYTGPVDYDGSTFNVVNGMVR